MWRISLTSTPRPVDSARAPSMSVTTRCRPFVAPGSVVVMPTGKAIECAEAGGGDADAEADRARGAGRRELEHAKRVARGVVDVELEAHLLLVERLRAVR